MTSHDDLHAGPADRKLVGYKGPTACAVAGITYRQLDYWARTKLVEPTLRPAAGSGTQRLYSFADVLVLKVVKRLLDTGVSLQNIRSAIEHLRAQGIEDLSTLTLVSDGASIYECRTDNEIIDLLNGGHGVFGISIGRVSQEVEGTLAGLPLSEVEELESPLVSANDELSRRRARRQAG